MKRDEMNAHVHPTMRPFLNIIFTPPVHQMKRESTGCGLDDTVTPVCSCGWRGRAIPGYHDFQMTEVETQEAQHRFSGCSVEEMRKAGAV